jgi:hypothetical protein
MSEAYRIKLYYMQGTVCTVSPNITTTGTAKTTYTTDQRGDTPQDQAGPRGLLGDSPWGKVPKEMKRTGCVHPTGSGDCMRI